MNRTIRSIALLAVLAAILFVGLSAQQKSGDTAIDPVCGMTVVKANAKGTFDYNGTTYYFCSTGCKEAFAKDPEKYLNARAKGEGAVTQAPIGQMHGAHIGQTPMPEAAPMAGCPMTACGMMMRGRMGMMHGRLRHGMACAVGGSMACGPKCPLHSADVEIAVEKTKDGAVLKVTSKNAETVKAIQEHMSEHVAMMKRMKETAAKASEAAACANCPMKK